MIRATCAAPGFAPSLALRLALWSALLALTGARAQVSVVDDTGSSVTLPQPAQRIVSLAPHITEQLFAIGAGDRLVGTSEFSDFPAAAKKIPRVGRAHSVDLERVTAARPDLIVLWGSGFPPAVLDALKRLGVPVYVNEPGALESIATSLERLGVLTAQPQAVKAAREFRARVASLRAQYAARPTVPVFYQIWREPLMTLGGRHVLSEAIRLCGGRNVFDTLDPIAPQVSIEAVVAAAPAVIVTAEAGGRASGALDFWKRFPGLPAVAHEALFILDADRLNRATPRMIEEVALLCARIDTARAHAR